MWSLMSNRSSVPGGDVFASELYPSLRPIALQTDGAKIVGRIPRSRKINLEKVLASLDAKCPKCGRIIRPAEVRHVDFEHIEGPACGEQFVRSPGS